jgi:hypothetical protein
MKKLSVYACAIALACGATVLLAAGTVRRSAIKGDQPGVRTDAAFRDGLFLGRLDANGSRKQHLISGRWADDADRRHFVSGYLQAYREMYGPVGAEGFLSSLPGQQTGYRDGIRDGFTDRQESKPSRPSVTENYRRADRLYSADSGDLNQYEQFYREAYCDGYQQGYYREP